MRSRRFGWTAVVVAFAATGGFVWLAWALAQGQLTTFDETTRAAVHAYSNPTLTFLMRAVTVMGMQIVILPATAMTAIYLFRKGDRDGAWLILVAVAGAEVIEITMKVQFHRQRPEPFFGTIPPGTYSFPSGHAVHSLCTFGLISWLIGARRAALPRRLIRVTAFVLILGVGLSRVYLGVHHPTDVIGGYLVTIAWVATLLAIRGRMGAAET